VNINNVIAIIETLETEVDGELLEAFQGDYNEDNDFSDWSSGNFDDDVQLGFRLGYYNAIQDVLAKFNEIKGETK